MSDLYGPICRTYMSDGDPERGATTGRNGESPEPAWNHPSKGHSEEKKKANEAKKSDGDPAGATATQRARRRERGERKPIQGEENRRSGTATQRARRLQRATSQGGGEGDRAAVQLHER